METFHTTPKGLLKRPMTTRPGSREHRFGGDLRMAPPGAGISWDTSGGANPESTPGGQKRLLHQGPRTHPSPLHIPFGTRTSNRAPTPAIPVSLIPIPVMERISRERKSPRPVPFPYPFSNIFSF